VSAAKRRSSAKKKRKAASPTGQAAVLGEYRTRWREVHAAYSAMQLRPLTLDETHLFGRILGSIIRGEDIREYFGTVPPIRRGRRSINSDRDLWISMHYWGMMELDKKDEIVRPLVAKSWGISESRVFAIANKYGFIYKSITKKPGLETKLAWCMEKAAEYRRSPAK